MTGFVAPESYQIEIDTAKWLGMPQGDDVGWIALTAPDGSTRRVELHSDQNPVIVAVPGIHCTDKLVMRAYGARRYEDYALALTHHIDLPPPESTAHRASFGVDSALAWVLPAAISGIAQPDGGLWSKYVGFQIGGWIDLRPARSSLRFGVQADFVYADRAIPAPHPSGDAGGVRTRYYRAPIVVTAGRSLTENVAIGFGTGVVFGGPFYDKRGLGFNHTDISTTLVGYLRYSLGRDVALEFRPALFIAEPQPSYDTDFKGDVYKQIGDLTSVLISLGVRADIASGPLIARQQ
ncbi:MAG TPA: hypothetical protein VNG33_02535 [Polyangiaceae bacterium]|nr:hypothetical protein [Polyangiaceae bacterium]